MSDMDSEVLEKILDPSTNFIERRRAFDEAMKWSWGQGWDACEDETLAVLQGLGVDFDPPVKPADMIVPERPAAEPEIPPVWVIEEVLVTSGRAVLPDGREVEVEPGRSSVRVPVLRPNR